MKMNTQDCVSRVGSVANSGLPLKLGRAFAILRKAPDPTAAAWSCLGQVRVAVSAARLMRRATRPMRPSSYPGWRLRDGQLCPFGAYVKRGFRTGPPCNSGPGTAR